MDDTRIRETVPTLRYLLGKKAIVILLSHLGRPDGKHKKELRLDPIARRLQRLLGKRVTKLDDCIGKAVEEKIKDAEPGSVFLLENVRFHAEEEKNDAHFSKQLARLGDLFVAESFGTAHRAHSSTAGIARYLPAYAGFLMEKEINALSPLLKNPRKPLALIIGGAKIDTKIGLIKSFFKKADFILIGGALANTFLAAEGHNIGASYYEKDKLDCARDILLEAQKKRVTILLPTDAILADSIDTESEVANLPLEDIEGEMKIFDIGALTLQKFIATLLTCKTVIWNGPLGLYEHKKFSGGTRMIGSALARMKKTKTYLGGGDTVDALLRSHIDLRAFTHVSTGGGAMLEFLEGKKLPGIWILQK